MMNACNEGICVEFSSTKHLLKLTR